MCIVQRNPTQETPGRTPGNTILLHESYIVYKNVQLAGPGEELLRYTKLIQEQGVYRDRISQTSKMASIIIYNSLPGATAVSCYCVKPSEDLLVQGADTGDSSHSWLINWVNKNMGYVLLLKSTYYSLKIILSVRKRYSSMCTRCELPVHWLVVRLSCPLCHTCSAMEQTQPIHTATLSCPDLVLTLSCPDLVLSYPVLSCTILSLSCIVLRCPDRDTLLIKQFSHYRVSSDGNITSCTFLSKHCTERTREPEKSKNRKIREPENLMAKTVLFFSFLLDYLQ